MEKNTAIGKVLMERTGEKMRAAAHRYGLMNEGRIDLRGNRLRFNHSELDLSDFLLDGCDLSGSVLTNCIGEGVSFGHCVLKRVRITAEKGKKSSFRNASFDDAVLEDATFGPRTLDMSGTAYRNAKLRNVTFTLGKLYASDFSGAQIEDVFFRSAELNRASFRNAKLTRVSFEKAVLKGADFTGAGFHSMEQWGEPNFDGAIISDELRYRFGIIREPLKKIDALLARGELDTEEADALRRWRSGHVDFLSNQEVMLIGSEYEDEIQPHLFARVLKALKKDLVH